MRFHAVNVFTAHRTVTSAARTIRAVRPARAVTSPPPQPITLAVNRTSMSSLHLADTETTIIRRSKPFPRRTSKSPTVRIDDATCLIRGPLGRRDQSNDAVVLAGESLSSGSELVANWHTLECQVKSYHTYLPRVPAKVADDN